MAKKKARSASSAPPSGWLDETREYPVIAEKARQLESFLAAVADGKIEKSEIDAQEQRVVQLMKEIEPQLPPDLHEKVGALLCELTAHTMMRMIYAFEEARPKAVFRG